MNFMSYMITDRHLYVAEFWELLVMDATVQDVNPLMGIRAR